MRMPGKKIYLWERNDENFLQCWPKNSRQAFLQCQDKASFFSKIKSSNDIYIPEKIAFDPLAARGILNSALMRFGKLYYQERTGVEFSQAGYVTKGSVHLKNSAGDTRLGAGMFFCTPANSPYTLYTDEDWHGMWFHLKNNSFLSNRLKHGCIYRKSEKIDELFFAATCYLKEIKKADRAYELLDAYAELIEICIRHDIARNQDKKFLDFMAQIKTKPAKYTSSAAAAESLGISAYELDKICTRETGMRFSKYLIAAKMSLARKYLLRMCTISEIASALGFADAFTFSKSFKSFHACTPSDFRKLNGHCNSRKYL